MPLIQIDIDRILSDFVIATNGHLATMRASLESLTDGTFYSKMAPKPGEAVKFALAVNVEGVKQKILNDTFLAIQRSFLESEIKFLAVIQMKDYGSTLTTNIQSPEALNRFVQDELKKIALKISRDRKMDNPLKIKKLCKNSPEFERVLLDYNTLRNDVEHHMSVSTDEAEFTYSLVQMTVDGTPTAIGPGTILLDGQRIGVRVENLNRRLRKGEKIVFTSDELEGMATYLQAWVMPKIVQSLSGK